MKSENKVSYSFEAYVISEDNIKDFSILENARKLRSNKVSSLKRLILKGDHFDAPIVVNKNGKLRVIDGQHRISAIKKAIETDPEFSISVLLVIYKGLSEKEERKIFNKWNIGQKQTSDDFVQMHKDEISIIKRMDKIFPVNWSIYKNKDAMHFKLLIGSYISARDFKMGGYMGGNEKFVDDAMELGLKDYEFLSRFVQEYVKDVFGEDFTNTFMNTTPFVAVMYLYLHNCKKISSEDFWERFRRKVMTSNDIQDMCRHGGRTVAKYVTDQMAIAMNSVRNSVPLQVPSKDRFISFENVNELEEDSGE